MAVYRCQLAIWVVFTLESLFARSVCQISAQRQHHITTSGDIFHPFRQDVRTFPPCCTQLLLLCFFCKVSEVPLETCLVLEAGGWSSLREPGSLVVSFTYPRSRMCHPGQLFPNAQGHSALAESFLGREGSTADGEWEEMRWEERSVFYLSQLLEQKGCSKGTQMWSRESARTLKWSRQNTDGGKQDIKVA